MIYPATVAFFFALILQAHAGGLRGPRREDTHRHHVRRFLQDGGNDMLRDRGFYEKLNNIKETADFLPEEMLKSLWIGSEGNSESTDDIWNSFDDNVVVMMDIPGPWDVRNMLLPPPPMNEDNFFLGRPHRRGFLEDRPCARRFGGPPPGFGGPPPGLFGGLMGAFFGPPRPRPEFENPLMMHPIRRDFGDEAREMEMHMQHPVPPLPKLEFNQDLTEARVVERPFPLERQDSFRGLSPDLSFDPEDQPALPLFGFGQGLFGSLFSSPPAEMAPNDDLTPWEEWMDSVMEKMNKVEEVIASASADSDDGFSASDEEDFPDAAFVSISFSSDPLDSEFALGDLLSLLVDLELDEGEEEAPVLELHQTFQRPSSVPRGPGIFLEREGREAGPHMRPLEDGAIFRWQEGDLEPRRPPPMTLHRENLHVANPEFDLMVGGHPHHPGMEGHGHVFEGVRPAREYGHGLRFEGGVRPARDHGEPEQQQQQKQQQQRVNLAARTLGAPETHTHQGQGQGQGQGRSGAMWGMTGLAAVPGLLALAALVYQRKKKAQAVSEWEREQFMMLHAPLMDPEDAEEEQEVEMGEVVEMEQPEAVVGGDSEQAPGLP